MRKGVGRVGQRSDRTRQASTGMCKPEELRAKVHRPSRATDTPIDQSPRHPRPCLGKAWTLSMVSQGLLLFPWGVRLRFKLATGFGVAWKDSKVFLLSSKRTTSNATLMMLIPCWLQPNILYLSQSCWTVFCFVMGYSCFVGFRVHLSLSFFWTRNEGPERGACQGAPTNHVQEKHTSTSQTLTEWSC